MFEPANLVLLASMTLVLLVALFLAVHAASMPFLIHMAMIALWALLFLGWAIRRIRNSPQI